MVALLPKVWCFGRQKKCGMKKTTSESKHPSSCTKRGKIKLEVYGKEMAE